MKKFTKIALLGIFCLVLPISSYGAYLIRNDKYQVSSSVELEEKKDIKVTFNYDKKTEERYFPSGYKLSLKDMPVISTASNYYSWTYDGKDISDLDIVLTNNIEINGVSTNFSDGIGSLNGEYKEENLNGHITVDSSATSSINYASNNDNNIEITDKVITKTTKSYISLATGNNHRTKKYASEHSLFDSIADGNAASNLKIVSNNVMVLGDGSIGLEAVGESVSDYKPVAGKETIQGSTNYCVYKFQLQNDVILKNEFILAGHNGYYTPVMFNKLQDESNNAYSYKRSRNYTGYIVGAYCEIDLNGHDLVLADGATLKAYGSITDSSSNRNGNLILESGSTLLTSFVTEGQYHETDIVSAYKYSFDPFRMFRCPYLDCSMTIKAGANYQGRLLKADGGNKGTTGFANTVTLVGPEASNPFIQLKSGIIKREVNYNQDLKNTGNSNIIKNIMYQKIKYSVYDADVDVRWLSFENISLSGASFSIYSYKYQMWIPPYFDFYIYNSSVKLHQEFIFMPGVYMYVDSNSEFTFSNNSIGEISINPALIDYVIIDGLQGVAGMVFLPKFHLVSQHGVEHSIINDGTGDSEKPIVYYNVNEFYEYYNQLGAVCDFYGKISFKDDDSNHTHKHEFGGNINIYDFASFKAQYKAHKDNISLYGNAVFADLVYGIKGTPLGIGAKKTVSFLAGGFYQIPLISNGLCMYDPENNSLITNTKYTYNAELSLIEKAKSTDKWFFKFTWPSSNMSHPYGSNSGEAGTVYTDGDSLLGNFVKASSVDSGNYTLISTDNQKYINFQGGYLIASSINGTSATAKLGLAVGGDGTNGSTDYTFTFIETAATFGPKRHYWKKS